MGLRWFPGSDVFAYKTENVASKHIWTKREILSQIGKLYDPNGYISPIVITAKILIQRIWEEKIDWDDRVPSSILNEWATFILNLTELNHTSIPLGMKASWYSELHCFCDASENAYGAVVYVKTITTDGRTFVEFQTVDRHWR